jgi:hypothetical protein
MDILFERRKVSISSLGQEKKFSVTGDTLGDF